MWGRGFVVAALWLATTPVWADTTALIDACDRAADASLAVGPIDAKAAIPACRVAVEAVPGGADAPRLKYQLGRAFEAAGSDAEARIWHEKAADAGSLPAMLDLGGLYRDGKGADAPDYVAARKWFATAAATGEPEGMEALGHFLILAKDYVDARRWLERAAAQGSGYAMYVLGDVYFQGYGVPVDYAAGEAWTEKAAAAGYTEAMLKLGRYYQLGGAHLAKDTVKARDWFGKAAAAGSPDGMYYLGSLLEEGLGGPRDEAEARRLYVKAADSGGDFDLASQVSSRLEQIADDTMKRDPAAARFWYEKAAAAGSPAAMDKLGDMFRDGRGVGKDPAKAKAWHDKSAAILKQMGPQ